MDDDKKPTGENQDPDNKDTQITEEDEQFLLGIDESDIESLDAESLTRLKEITKKSKETVSQKNHWRDKAKKAQEALKPKENEKKPEQSPAPSMDKERVEKMEFRQENGKLTKEDVDEIFAYAKTKGITPEEALNSRVIKSMLKSKEDEEESEEAAPKTNGGRAPKPKVEIEPSQMTAAQIRARREEMLRQHR